jgi:nucleotide-binding universal stress UspA family protein
VTCQVEPGSVVETIINTARERGCDLIVMATHGRTGLTRAILGSVAADVLPKAPCPVLVVPPSKA